MLQIVIEKKIMASTDETFLPCGSPYRTSHRIGRYLAEATVTLTIEWVDPCVVSALVAAIEEVGGFVSSR